MLTIGELPYSRKPKTASCRPDPSSASLSCMSTATLLEFVCGTLTLWNDLRKFQTSGLPQRKQLCLGDRVFAIRESPTSSQGKVFPSCFKQLFLLNQETKTPGATSDVCCGGGRAVVIIRTQRNVVGSGQPGLQRRHLDGKQWKQQKMVDLLSSLPYVHVCFSLVSPNSQFVN